MPSTIADASRSVLLVIDMQPSFLKAIHEAQRVVRRVGFLVRIANLVGVPVIATEQYPERMAGTDERILSLLQSPPIGKTTFSCVGCEAFHVALNEIADRQSTISSLQTSAANRESRIDNPNSPLQTPNLERAPAGTPNLTGATLQAVLIGIETHICVTQTALHLLEAGYDAKVCEDAVSARVSEMNEIGFRRLRHASIDVAHTESIAYEWLKRADNPVFREALKVVKEFS